MSETDRAIFERWVLQRDAEAFHTIVSRHSGMVLATCRRIMRDGTEAEDVAQECFEALAFSKRVPRTDSVAPWLHGVAVKRSIQRIRSEGSRRGRERRFAAAQELNQQAALDDVYGFVDEAIAKLPDKFRLPIVARFLEGESQTEIARSMGVSPGTVSYRLRTGIELVRKSLRKRGIPVTTSVLAAMLGGNLAQAAPPAFTATLGKLALAGVERAAIECAGGATTHLAWLNIGGILTMKKAAIVLAVIILGLGTWWLADKFRADMVAQNAENGTTVLDEEPDLSVAENAKQIPLAEATVEESGTTESAVTKDIIVAAEEVDSGKDEAPPESISISGYVVDSEGMGIAGATVYLMPSDSLPWLVHSSAFQQDLFHSQLYRATADSGGAFTFPDVIPGKSHIVEVSAPGYFSLGQLSLSLNSGHNHEDLILTLRPGISLYGEIRDPNGRPIPDALVRSIGFLSEKSSYSQTEFELADSQGRFTFGFGHPDIRTSESLTGVTSIEVRTEALGATLFTYVPVGENEIIVLQWPEGGALEGTITGADRYAPGELSIALAGSISLQSYLDDGQLWMSTTGRGPKYQATVSQEGRYRIEGIATAQSYKLDIHNAAGELLMPTIQLDAFEEGKTQVFDYSLEQVTTLAGVVRGTISGQPLSDLQVRWRSLDSPKLTDSGKVNDDGTYRLELRASAGRYVVYPLFITHDLPEYEEAYGRTITIEPGLEKSVDLTFMDPVTRTVLVIDEFGEPITRANMGYVESHRNTWNMGWQTDDSGRFTYHGVRPYEEVHFSVYVPGSDYKGAQTETFAAEPGQVFEEEVVVLYPKGN